jgi:hypothetical protein
VGWEEVGNMAESVKAVYVGRHKLLPAQQKALTELKIEIHRQIENLPSDPTQLRTLVEELKAEGVQAVMTIALPPHLLAVLSEKFPVYVFEMKSATVKDVSEAERWVAENPQSRTYLPGRPNEPIRTLEFVGVNLLKVVIESKRVWPQ